MMDTLERFRDQGKVLTFWSGVAVGMISGLLLVLLILVFTSPTGPVG